MRAHLPPEGDPIDRLRAASAPARNQSIPGARATGSTPKHQGANTGLDAGASDCWDRRSNAENTAERDRPQSRGLEDLKDFGRGHADVLGRLALTLLFCLNIEARFANRAEDVEAFGHEAEDHL